MNNAQILFIIFFPLFMTGLMAFARSREDARARRQRLDRLTGKRKPKGSDESFWSDEEEHIP